MFCEASSRCCQRREFGDLAAAGAYLGCNIIIITKTCLQLHQPLGQLVVHFFMLTHAGGCL